MNTAPVLLAQDLRTVILYLQREIRAQRATSALKLSTSSTPTASEDLQISRVRLQVPAPVTRPAITAALPAREQQQGRQEAECLRQINALRQNSTVTLKNVRTPFGKTSTARRQNHHATSLTASRFAETNWKKFTEKARNATHPADSSPQSGLYTVCINLRRFHAFCVEQFLHGRMSVRLRANAWQNNAAKYPILLMN